MEQPPEQPTSWLYMNPIKPEGWLHAAEPNGEQGPNIPLNDYLEEAQNLPVPPATSEIPPPPHRALPIRELPPRRGKVVNIWTCSRQCICGVGGMKVSVEPCPQCGIARCPSCRVDRVRFRPSNPTLSVDETDARTNAE
ncbi:hypothetical protein EDB80DRAFT_684659 [Ilyonectria destructans]|nr:hypothetical protein EDB80DRAFT_684659 [Ilyonectria destructans]